MPQVSKRSTLWPAPEVLLRKARKPAPVQPCRLACKVARAPLGMYARKTGVGGTIALAVMKANCHFPVALATKVSCIWQLMHALKAVRIWLCVHATKVGCTLLSVSANERVCQRYSEQRFKPAVERCRAEYWHLLGGPGA